MAARRSIVARAGRPAVSLACTRMLGRNPRVPLYGVAVCAGLFAVLLVVAYSSGRARHFDASAFQGFVEIRRGHGATVSDRLSALGGPLAVALIALGLAAVALLRQRPRLALAVLLLVAATSVSGQLLKALLAYPRAAGHWI